MATETDTTGTTLQTELVFESRPIRGVVAVEGQKTVDGRLIQQGALSWRDEVALMWNRTSDGHMTSSRIGTLTRFERRGDDIWGFGRTIADEEGEAFANLAETREAGWPSIDVADVDVVITIDGVPISDEEEPILIAESQDGEELVELVSGVITAVTIVQEPAIDGTFIEIGEDEAKVASVSPLKPPREWFEDPKLDGPTPITITEEGRIYGHLAQWGTCHIGIEGSCFTAPHSQTDYAHFMLGAQETEEGVVAVGKITLAGGHADLRLNAQEAQRHYDDTDSAAAHVIAGEDEHGIYLSGCILSLTEEERRTLLASPLSGDWRFIGGNLELVASLAVNVPGYPVTRSMARVASGVQQSLITAVWSPSFTASGAPDLEKRLRSLEARFAVKELDERFGTLRVDAYEDSQTLDVFTVQSFEDLPFAERESAWDAGEADTRVRKWASSDNSGDPDTIDWDKYFRAFMWRDPDDSEVFGGYKLGFADIVDGRLHVVFQALGAVAGGRGVEAADIPDEDKDGVKSLTCSYYEKARKVFDDDSIECPFTVKALDE